MSLLSVRLAAFHRGLERVELGSQLPREVLLLYDFASWRGLLVRDDQLTVGTLVNVIVLSMPWRNHSETKKKGETKRKIQSCTLTPGSCVAEARTRR